MGGKKQKEEARRKKFGFMSKKYDPDAQPWLMRVGSKKEGKHFKGVREGGVSNNTTYYVFTHAQDGSFEVHPVKEWYNFTPRATYKTLNAEEAEEKFEQRNKVLNKWAVMINKKVRPEGEEGAGDDDDDEGGGAGKGGKKSKDKSFKVSDMDDWVDDGDGLDSDDEEEDEEGGADKKSKKGKDKDKDDKGGKDSRKKKKKSKYDVENEAFEDSDDGDDEHRELDYITDESSEGEEEMQEAVELKGVDQDDGGLRKMLGSDASSSDSDEEEKKKDDKKEDDKEEGEEKDKDEKGGKGKKGKGKKSDKKGEGENGSAPGSRSGSPKPGGEGKEGGGAASAKKEKAEKRKALINDILDPNEGPDTKRARTSEASGSAEAMFEEDVRRYLARKPMTTTEILKKINTRKTGIPKEELMPLLVSALKRINPHKQKVKGIMYLSLKSN